MCQDISLALFIHPGFLQLADDAVYLLLVDLSVRFGRVDHGLQHEFGTLLQLLLLRLGLGSRAPGVPRALRLPTPFSAL